MDKPHHTWASSAQRVYGLEITSGSKEALWNIEHYLHKFEGNALSEKIIDSICDKQELICQNPYLSNLLQPI